MNVTAIRIVEQFIIAYRLNGNHHRLEVIEAHEAEDPKAVMIAIKTICDYELLDNPYRSHVHLMKTKAKEL